MVSKRYQLRRNYEKTIKYFEPILKTYCSEECLIELMKGYINKITGMDKSEFDKRRVL